MTAPGDRVAAEARKWIGTPWLHQGRNEHGIDCVGLVVVVARALGVSDYDFGNYSRNPDGWRLLPHFAAGGATRIDPKDARKGDMLVFRYYRYPCHVGILVEDTPEPRVVHASAVRGTTMEEPLSAIGNPVAGNLLVAAYRMPNPED
jgi:cell wall-associated NlpC family hydrolase